jgi:hypothetical protein
MGCEELVQFALLTVNVPLYDPGVTVVPTGLLIMIGLAVNVAPFTLVKPLPIA